MTSSIPSFFQNSEPSSICYKYNKSNRKAMDKPIRNLIFNFIKRVSDLVMSANTPE